MAKQKGTPAGVQVDPADPVQQARTKARQRLIGAAVLLVIGIVAFPLVFETAPRPVPVDLPIDIPRKDAVPPLAMPSLPASRPAVATAPAATPAPTPAPTPTPTPTAEAAPVSPTPPAAVATAPPDVAPALPAPPPAAEARVASPPSDGARARAILEARDAPASASGNGRFVVQVGAFADAAAARETRAKVEKLGLKTYTQVADTAQGSRIRVRVGPFASRDDADTALAKTKAAGIAAVVLTL